MNCEECPYHVKVDADYQRYRACRYGGGENFIKFSQQGPVEWCPLDPNAKSVVTEYLKGE